MFKFLSKTHDIIYDSNLFPHMFILPLSFFIVIKSEFANNIIDFMMLAFVLWAILILPCTFILTVLIKALGALIGKRV